MKRLIFAVGLSLALAGAALAGPLSGYTNYGEVTTPTNIDATNVVNLGLFDFSIFSYTSGPYQFSDVQTYTNRGIIYIDLGVQFDTEPGTQNDPPAGPAAGFENDNPGQIYAGGLLPMINGSVPLIIQDSGTFPQLIINATNIKSSGLLDTSETGRIGITGGAVDLSRGDILVEGLDLASSGVLPITGSLGPGVFDNYWGTGFITNKITQSTLTTLFPIFTLTGGPTATTPGQIITNISGTATTNFTFTIDNAQAVALTNIISASNIVTQVIVFGDSIGEVQMVAFFDQGGGPFADDVVEWQSTVTNVYGDLVNNNLFLTDTLGTLLQNTNTTLAAKVSSTSPSGIQSLVPNNFTLLPTFTPVGNETFGNALVSTNLFTNAFGSNTPFGSTNVYSALGVNLSDVTARPDTGQAGSTLSNIPGRLEITANQTLDLTDAQISAGNYLNLSSTNHFVGSAGAQVQFPFADLNLATTNGLLTISNLVAPYDPHITGPIDCLSLVWTNFTGSSNIMTNITGAGTTNAATNVVTNVFTITNTFQILMVSSSLQPTTQVFVDSLGLRSTNVVISDILNVQDNLLINAQNLTITSNQLDDVTPEGELVLTGIDNLYSALMPGMETFTNFGLVETPNAAFFQFRQNPFGPMPGDGPWQSVANYNEIISGGGDVFWASNFVDVGSFIQPSVIEAEFGPVSVQANTAVVSNSDIVAFDGDLSFTCGTLLVTNDLIEANGLFANGNGFFDLAVTNLLSDGSIQGDFTSGGSGNAWQSGDGFSLLVAPQSGNLLGTSVTSSCLPNVQCQNVWAGVPQNLTTNGLTNAFPIMSNNVPIGQLILTGGNTVSVFHFKGPDSVNPYAMYVDQLELEGGAMNTNKVGTNTVYTAFNIDPNVNIYFLDALSGVKDISAQLNGAANGHLHWVSNYVGVFSKTNITFPDQTTYAFNRGLAAAGYSFAEPAIRPLTPQSINLTATLTNAVSAGKAVISWYAPANSTSTLFTRGFGSSNWQPYTNIVQGTNAGRLSVTAGLPSSNCLYRVSVSQ